MLIDINWDFPPARARAPKITIKRKTSLKYIFFWLLTDVALVNKNTNNTNMHNTNTDTDLDYARKKTFLSYFSQSSVFQAFSDVMVIIDEVSTFCRGQFANLGPHLAILLLTHPIEKWFSKVFITLACGVSIQRSWWHLLKTVEKTQFCCTV